MSDSNTIKITPSPIDVDGKLMTILQSNMEQLGIKDVDFLRAGYFGALKSSLSMAIRDSAYYKSFLFKENFIATASTPEAIYRHAKLFNINVLLAKPASVNLMFQIPIEDINNKINAISDINRTTYNSTNYGISNSTKCIILDKKYPIIADNVYFSLEHSIAIIDNTNVDKEAINNTTVSSSYIVEYCTSEKLKTTEFNNYTNNRITSSIAEYNGVKYLIFMCVAYQYSIVTQEKLITTSNQINSKVFEFNFDNQIAGMSVDYIKGDKEEHVDLYFSNLRSKKTSANKYAYYSLEDENTIKLVFMSGEAGLPQNGGTLKFNIFETLGKAGNIQFNGNAIMNITDNKISDLPITITFIDGTSIGGDNKPDLDSIKNSIVTLLSTKDTIITENDLNRFFQNEIKHLSEINNASISFKKERDDFMKRSFYAMIGIRNNSSNELDNWMIPTNTIDIKYNIKTKDAKNGFIELNPNNSISYNVVNREYVVDDKITSSDGTYKIPFNLIVQLDNFKKSSYIYLATNDSSELNFMQTTSLNNTLLPSTVSIYKDIISDIYEISFYVSSDIPLANESYKENTGFLKLITYLNENAYNQYNIPKEAIEINTVGDEDTEGNIKQYEIKIKLKVNNTLYNSDSNNKKLEVSAKFATNTSDNMTNASIMLNSNIKFGLKISTFSNNNSVDVALIGKNFLNVYSELDDIMSSSIILNKTKETISGTDGTDKDVECISSITIKGVPVIASYYALNHDVSSFIKQLMIYINMLKANAEKLESNTFFNLKFKNTYGTSYYYDSINTNIRLKLNIYLNNYGLNRVSNSLDNTINLETEIRNAIRLFVDAANNDHELSVTKIIANILSEYNKFIAHVEFVSLNGSFNQYIKAISLLTDNNEYISSKYVDEYFTIDMTKDINGKTQLENDILFYSGITLDKLNI